MATTSDSIDWELMPPRSGTRNPEQQEKQQEGRRFANKVIVITGAGGQLGREGCIYFNKMGARIAALDLSEQGLTETYECLGNDNVVDYKPYICNVTDPEQVQNVMTHIAKIRFGKIDYLWNNAGYQGQIEPILEQSSCDFANVMNINVTGMFHVLQAVGHVMVDQRKEGNNDEPLAIVNTASVAGLRGTPAMVGYASSKAAVLAMSICAAKEWACHNIRVNSISPALIGPGKLWDRQNELHAKVGKPYFPDTPENVATAKINSVPMKRLGTSQEVVKSVAFLLSDEASYTTGINLTVDGGMAAGLKA